MVEGSEGRRRRGIVAFSDASQCDQSLEVLDTNLGQLSNMDLMLVGLQKYARLSLLAQARRLWLQTRAMTVPRVFDVRPHHCSRQLNDVQYRCGFTFSQHLYHCLPSYRIRRMNIPAGLSWALFPVL